MMKASGKALILLAVPAMFWACNSEPIQILDLAEARWRKGYYDDAIQLNRLAYHQDPQGETAATALLNLGNIQYLNLRDLEKAILAYNRVIDEFPDSAAEYLARRSLAEIYANEIGDLTQAIAEYDKILDSGRAENPDQIRFERANAYFRKEDFNQALPEFRRLEESGLDGHMSDQVELKIGAIYMIYKRFEDAQVAFEKAARSNCLECRQRAIRNLAETYENLYEFDRALEVIGRLDPTPENQQYMAREMARIEGKKRRLQEKGEPGKKSPGLNN
jgi:tetratricopeptide (TPR) repeat protein